MKQFERQVAPTARRDGASADRAGGVRRPSPTARKAAYPSGPRFAGPRLGLAFMEAYSRAHRVDRSGDLSFGLGRERSGNTRASANRRDVARLRPVACTSRAFANDELCTSHGRV